MASNQPRTEADWAAWEREQKGLPPLKVKEPKQPKPMPTPDELRAKAVAHRQKQAKRQREARARDPKRRAGVVISMVKAKPPAKSEDGEMPTAPTEPGDVEKGIRAQCANLAKAEEMPGTVALAITLARKIDSDEYGALAPQLARNLQQIMASLQGPKKKTSGRLQVVRSMSAAKARVAQ